MASLRESKYKWVIVGVTAIVIIAIIIIIAIIANRGGEEASSSTFTTIFIAITIIVVLALIGLGLWYLNKKAGFFDLDFIVSVHVDRALELFRENIAKKWKIKFYIDHTNDGKIVFPDEMDFFVHNIFEHKENDDDFITVEFETNTGLVRGIHMAVINLSKGEEAIRQGGARVQTHTSFNRFKKMPRTFKPSTPRDKQLRIANALIENETELDAQKIQLIRSLSTPQNTSEGGIKSVGDTADIIDDIKQATEISDDALRQLQPESRGRYSRKK